MDTFGRACREADRKAASRPEDPRILRTRRLLADESISYERFYGELMRNRPAPESTVDALVHGLRRGVSELTKLDTQQRLSELDADQLEAVCLRVQAFQPNIAPAWAADDADLLISAWRKFHEQR